MSQQINVTINCPNCGDSYNSKLFRTVCGEQGPRLMPYGFYNFILLSDSKH